MGIGKMKKYIALVRIQFKDNFAYRLSTVASIAVGIIQVYIYYVIWCKVYDNSYMLKEFSLEQMSTYVILGNVLYKLVEFGITLRISDLVRTGEIAIKLTKPIGFIKSLFCESLGGLLSNIFTLILPILIFCLIIIPFFIQKNVVVVFLFFASMCLGIWISIFIDIIFGLMTFWTENGWGLRVIRQALMKLFSGAIVPLAFLPSWFGKICDLLPFKTLIDMPIRIYLFGFDEKIINQLLVQFLWVVVLYIFTKALYKIIINKMQVNGG